MPGGLGMQRRWIRPYANIWSMSKEMQHGRVRLPWQHHNRHRHRCIGWVFFSFFFFDEGRIRRRFSRDFHTTLTRIHFKVTNPNSVVWSMFPDQKWNFFKWQVVQRLGDPGVAANAVSESSGECDNNNERELVCFSAPARMALNRCLEGCGNIRNLFRLEWHNRRGQNPSSWLAFSMTSV